MFWFELEFVKFNIPPDWLPIGMPVFSTVLAGPNDIVLSAFYILSWSAVFYKGATIIPPSNDYLGF